MNQRQRIRNLAISEIKEFFSKSVPETKEDMEKIIMVIMSKYKLSRRTAREYISVAVFEAGQ